MERLSSLYKAAVVALLGSILSAVVGAVLWLARIDHDSIKAKAESAYILAEEDKVGLITIKSEMEHLKQEIALVRADQVTIITNEEQALANHAIILANQKTILRYMEKR